MTWGNIDFAAGRFTVRSPKTAHQGNASRVCPIFPELLSYLQEAYELAEDGEIYLITRYRDKASNLRTQAQRIIKRAMLTPWPKIFQNLRSSRETELVHEHPVHVVTKWLGNSPRIAQMHYLQITENDFQRAIAKPEKWAGLILGQNVGLTASASQCQKMTPETAKTTSRTAGTSWHKKAPNCFRSQGLTLTPRGVEPRLPG